MLPLSKPSIRRPSEDRQRQSVFGLEKGLREGGAAAKDDRMTRAHIDRLAMATSNLELGMKGQPQ